MVVVPATSCTFMLRGTTLLMIVMNKYVQCKQTTCREVPLSRSDAGEGLGVRAIGGQRGGFPLQHHRRDIEHCCC